MSHISLRANLQPVPAIWQSICKLEYARQRQKIKKTSKWSKLSVLNKAKQQARHGQSTKKKKKNVDRKKWTQDLFFFLKWHKIIASEIVVIMNPDLCDCSFSKLKCMAGLQFGNYLYAQHITWSKERKTRIEIFHSLTYSVCCQTCCFPISIW